MTFKCYISYKCTNEFCMSLNCFTELHLIETGLFNTFSSPISLLFNAKCPNPCQDVSLSNSKRQRCRGRRSAPLSSAETRPSIRAVQRCFVRSNSISEFLHRTHHISKTDRERSAARSPLAAHTHTARTHSTAGSAGNNKPSTDSYQQGR